MSERRWQHRKRGRTYVEVARGNLQMSIEGTDNVPCVIYRSEADGSWWARPVHEFEDGRFIPLPSAAVSEREKIARIIDPDAFREFEFAKQHGWKAQENGYRTRVNQALAKADLIVSALRASPSAEGVDQVRDSLEKISGARNYTGEDYAVSAHYKSDEGLWTVDEYLADIALAALSARPATEAPAEGKFIETLDATIDALPLFARDYVRRLEMELAATEAQTPSAVGYMNLYRSPAGLQAGTADLYERRQDAERSAPKNDLRYIGIACVALGQTPEAQTIERLRKALERLFVCGNHIALYKSDRWPAYQLDGLTRAQQCENALRILGATQDYDMWCCWSGMMQERDALASASPVTITAGQRDGGLQ